MLTWLTGEVGLKTLTLPLRSEARSEPVLHLARRFAPGLSFRVSTPSAVLRFGERHFGPYIPLHPTRCLVPARLRLSSPRSTVRVSTPRQFSERVLPNDLEHGFLAYDSHSDLSNRYPISPFQRSIATIDNL